MHDERSARLLGYVIATLGPILLACALVGVREDVDTANLALVMVLVVVFAAVTGGWKPGAVAAIVSTMSFDFFLTRPYLSMTIESGDDVETAILLLGVGVCVGLVASRTQLARRAVAKSRDEIERIHRVADLSARGSENADVLLAAQAELLGLLQLRDCRFEPGPSGFFPQIDRSGAITGTDVHYYATREFELPREGVELPVLSRGRHLGQFVLRPTPGRDVALEQRVVAVAIADQVGAVLTSPEHA